MGRELVIGDIHGAYRALIQVLARCGFNDEEDTLISLGDVVDGWGESFEVVERLLKIKNRIDIKGNHDDWLHQYLATGRHPMFQSKDTTKPHEWGQGAEATKQSYMKHAGQLLSLNPGDIPETHHKFFNGQHGYYREGKTLFIHGGFNRHMLLSQHTPYQFWWDRDLWEAALSAKAGKQVKVLKNVEGFERIFIGHTATTNWRTKEKIVDAGITIPIGEEITRPMYAAGVWNLDTGAGWNGKLTIMDVNTEEYWQSDCVTTLYPEELGRR